MPVDIFAAAIDALFDDPNLGLDAAYRAGGVGLGAPLRVILRRPDRVGDLGDTRLLTETAVFDIRVLEIPAPAAGDTIEVDQTVYVVQGEPVRDAERLIWMIEARPQ